MSTMVCPLINRTYITYDGGINVVQHITRTVRIVVTTGLVNVNVDGVVIAVEHITRVVQIVVTTGQVHANGDMHIFAFEVNTV